MVGVIGFEPTTPCSQSKCATPALHSDKVVKRSLTYRELEAFWQYPLSKKARDSLHAWAR